MKTFKLFALFILIISFGALVAFGQKKVVHPIKPKDFDGLGFTQDFKVLAEGFNSKVDAPFVFVARDAKTYARLQNLVEGLPSASTIDFKQSAVVAGFAGTKSTGGWTLEIRKSGERIGVFIQAPRQDMMVTQALTTPFKVSLVPIEEDKAVSLNLAPDFIKKMRVFRLNQGDFEFSGGFAFKRKQFKAAGTIRLITFGDEATFWFDLKGQGAEQKRRLSEMASGTLKNGKIELARLDAGSFSDRPRPPFEVEGTLKSKVLSLSFEPLPTNVADGYAGKGSLAAIRMK